MNKLINARIEPQIADPGAARGLRCTGLGRSLAGIAGSNPARPGERLSVSSECYVLSDGGLCDGSTPRLEESYRVPCVCVIVNPQK
jgi:hypothetical protein